LTVLRADAGAEDSYSGYDFSVNATFGTDGKISWETGAEMKYPKNGKNVKLIGLHPRGTVTIPTGSGTTTVTYSGFDGTDDIMCSGFLEGNKDDAIEEKMAFSHLLTQVQVYVKGEDGSSVYEWGKVTGITITDKAGTVVVNVPDPQTGSTPTLSPIEDPGALTVPTSTDGSFGANAAPYGVVMFVPSESDETLTFNVTTANNDGVIVLPTKTERSYEASTAYKVTIEFKNDGEIDIDIDISGDDGSILEWIDAESGEEEELEAGAGS
jgi:hypothetical protein